MATTDSQDASYNCASANGHAEGGVDGPDVFTCRTSSFVVIGVNADVCLCYFYQTETFKVRVLNTQVLNPDLVN